MPLPESAATTTRWYALGSSLSNKGWRKRNQIAQGPLKKTPCAIRVSTRSAYPICLLWNGKMATGESSGPRGAAGRGWPGRPAKRIAAAHQATARQVIKSSNAPERAGILLAIVAGFQMMRQMMRLEVLADADPALLANLLTSIFTTILGRPVLHR
jgi:hypothetical protein